MRFSVETMKSSKCSSTMNDERMQEDESHVANRSMEPPMPTGYSVSSRISSFESFAKHKDCRRTSPQTMSSPPTMSRGRAFAKDPKLCTERTNDSSEREVVTCTTSGSSSTTDECPLDVSEQSVDREPGSSRREQPISCEPTVAPVAIKNSQPRKYYTGEARRKPSLSHNTERTRVQEAVSKGRLVSNCTTDAQISAEQALPTVVTSERLTPRESGEIDVAKAAGNASVQLVPTGSAVAGTSFLPSVQSRSPLKARWRPTVSSLVATEAKMGIDSCVTNSPLPEWTGRLRQPVVSPRTAPSWSKEPISAPSTCLSPSRLSTVAARFTESAEQTVSTRTALSRRSVVGPAKDNPHSPFIQAYVNPLELGERVTNERSPSVEGTSSDTAISTAKRSSSGATRKSVTESWSASRKTVVAVTNSDQSILRGSTIIAQVGNIETSTCYQRVGLPAETTTTRSPRLNESAVSSKISDFESIISYKSSRSMAFSVGALCKDNLDSKKEKTADLESTLDVHLQSGIPTGRTYAVAASSSQPRYPPPVKSISATEPANWRSALKRPNMRVSSLPSLTSASSPTNTSSGSTSRRGLESCPATVKINTTVDTSTTARHKSPLYKRTSLTSNQRVESGRTVDSILKGSNSVTSGEPLMFLPITRRRTSVTESAVSDTSTEITEYMDPGTDRAPQAWKQALSSTRRLRAAKSSMSFLPIGARGFARPHSGEASDPMRIGKAAKVTLKSSGDDTSEMLTRSWAASRSHSSYEATVLKDTGLVRGRGGAENALVCSPGTAMHTWGDGVSMHAQRRQDTVSMRSEYEGTRCFEFGEPNDDSKQFSRLLDMWKRNEASSVGIATSSVDVIRSGENSTSTSFMCMSQCTQYQFVLQMETGGMAWTVAHRFWELAQVSVSLSPTNHPEFTVVSRAYMFESVVLVSSTAPEDPVPSSGRGEEVDGSGTKQATRQNSARCALADRRMRARFNASRYFVKRVFGEKDLKRTLTQTLAKQERGLGNRPQKAHFSNEEVKKFLESRYNRRHPLLKDSDAKRKSVRSFEVKRLTAAGEPATNSYRRGNRKENLGNPTLRRSRLDMNTHTLDSERRAKRDRGSPIVSERNVSTSIGVVSPLTAARELRRRSNMRSRSNSGNRSRAEVSSGVAPNPSKRSSSTGRDLVPSSCENGTDAGPPAFCKITSHFLKTSTPSFLEYSPSKEISHEASFNISRCFKSKLSTPVHLQPVVQNKNINNRNVRSNLDKAPQGGALLVDDVPDSIKRNGSLNEGVEVVKTTKDSKKEGKERYSCTFLDTATRSPISSVDDDGVLAVDTTEDSAGEEGSTNKGRFSTTTCGATACLDTTTCVIFDQGIIKKKGKGGIGGCLSSSVCSAPSFCSTQSTEEDSSDHHQRGSTGCKVIGIGLGDAVDAAKGGGRSSTTGTTATTAIIENIDVIASLGGSDEVRCLISPISSPSVSHALSSNSWNIEIDHVVVEGMRMAFVGNNNTTTPTTPNTASTTIQKKKTDYLDNDLGGNVSGSGVVGIDQQQEDQYFDLEFLFQWCRGNRGCNL